MKIEIGEEKILRMAEAIKALRKLDAYRAAGSRYPVVLGSDETSGGSALDNIDGYYQYRAQMTDLVDAYHAATLAASKAVLDGVRSRLTAIANGLEAI